MTWIFFALLAHLGNGIVFIFDKALLSTPSAISSPYRYAFYSAVVSAATIVILPFNYAPLTQFVFAWTTIAAAFFLLALLFFFTALRSGEPSRVVPLVGSIVPIGTLIFASYALGERLGGEQLVAVLLLVAGGTFLSVRFSRSAALSLKVILFTIAGGLAFAAHFAAMKFLYSNSQAFLAVFVYSRVMVAVLALVVLGPFVLFLQEKKKQPTTKPARTGAIAAAFFGSKILSMLSFLLQNYAISIGSVTIVNALQGTQYLFVLIISLAISAWYPSLFQEEMHRVALSQKVIGILLVSIGLALLV